MLARGILTTQLPAPKKRWQGLSGEFKNWMRIEADRLSAAHAAILKNGFTDCHV